MYCLTKIEETQTRFGTANSVSLNAAKDCWLFKWDRSARCNSTKAKSLISSQKISKANYIFRARLMEPPTNSSLKEAHLYDGYGNGGWRETIPCVPSSFFSSLTKQRPPTQLKNCFRSLSMSPWRQAPAATNWLYPVRGLEMISGIPTWPPTSQFHDI